MGLMLLSHPDARMLVCKTCGGEKGCIHATMVLPIPSPTQMYVRIYDMKNI